MSTATGKYEFTPQQNELLSSLAGRMGFVGLLSVLLGLVNLGMAGLGVAGVYRERIPAEWKTKTDEYLEVAREKLPEDLKKQAEEYSLDKLPPDNQLWGLALNTGVAGIFFMLLGIWTRSAAGSFRRITRSQGNDIEYLMNGMSSLNRMYVLLSTLLKLVVVAGLLAGGLTLIQRYFH